jgi:cephalosporin hydroxylase
MYHPNLRGWSMSQIPRPQQIQLKADDVISWFHQVYYAIGHQRSGTWMQTFWMGTSLEKCPLDLWIYQELLHAIRPQLIIETGTRWGGSALYLSHICDLLGVGEVVTIDVTLPPTPPAHRRLTYLTGSSIDPEIIQRVKERAVDKSPILVILDSDHSSRHVIEEMRAYHSLVTPESYMIVEDGNINGHPVFPTFGPGPTEAIEQFLRENNDFEVNRNCEKFLLTFNPGGYLRKRANSPAPLSPPGSLP